MNQQSQHFCLKWNNHQSNMLSSFEDLLHSECLVDVTLGCEGNFVKAHKMVLSACSSYFQALFMDNPCKHPIVILKDVRFHDLKALVDFMYKGEVSVAQDQLHHLLKTAEMLKIKGLTEVSGGQYNNSGGGSTAPRTYGSAANASSAMNLQSTNRLLSSQYNSNQDRGSYYPSNSLQIGPHTMITPANTKVQQPISALQQSLQNSAARNFSTISNLLSSLPYVPSAATITPANLPYSPFQVSTQSQVSPAGSTVYPLPLVSNNHLTRESPDLPKRKKFKPTQYKEADEDVRGDGDEAQSGDEESASMRSEIVEEEGQESGDEGALIVDDGQLRDDDNCSDVGIVDDCDDLPPLLEPKIEITEGVGAVEKNESEQGLSTFNQERLNSSPFGTARLTLTPARLMSGGSLLAHRIGAANPSDPSQPKLKLIPTSPMKGETPATNGSLLIEQLKEHTSALFGQPRLFAAHAALLANRPKLGDAAKSGGPGQPGSTTPRRTKGGRPTILYEEEEDLIANFITTSAIQGNPVDVKNILGYGNKLLAQEGRRPTGAVYQKEHKKGLSIKWWRGFKKRHPGLPYVRMKSQKTTMNNPLG